MLSVSALIKSGRSIRIEKAPQVLKKLNRWTILDWAMVYQKVIPQLLTSNSTLHRHTLCSESVQSVSLASVNCTESFQLSNFLHLLSAYSWTFCKTYLRKMEWYLSVFSQLLCILRLRSRCLIVINARRKLRRNFRSCLHCCRHKSRLVMSQVARTS